jgi:hypothetical protein
MKTGITNKLLTLLRSAITALATRAAIALFNCRMTQAIRQLSIS